LRRLVLAFFVLALLGGTAAAFTVTEGLKLERSPLNPHKIDEVFSPTCGCPTRVAKLSFRLRQADRLDLVIVSGDEPVRTLARDLERQPGRVFVRWDGKDDSGAIVPDGVYRLRVLVHEADRTIVFPQEIRIDTEAPALEVLGATPSVFSPDGDGRDDTTTLALRTSEAGQALVFVEGKLAVEARMQTEGEEEVTWDGSVDGSPLEEGFYTLFARARDLAGNLSPAESVSVRIRYLEVVPNVVVARRGARLRFRVLTDASTISWTLRKPGGRDVLTDARAKPGSIAVLLPGRIRAGRYVLVVVANGHRERSLVRVVRHG
jgi:flagellar hook assembly protein FlgD